MKKHGHTIPFFWLQLNFSDRVFYGTLRLLTRNSYFAMTVNPSIFKSYDIRGVYPTDLHEEAAKRIARALIALTGARSIAVGRDVRISSPALWTALTDELIALGCDVTDLGLIPTEVIYYVAGTYDFGVTMTVTASHNPSEYNGFKMMRGKSDVIRGTDVATMFDADVPAAITPGTRHVLDALTPYLQHILAKVDTAILKPVKVVIDTGNGTAGHVIPKLMANLPTNVVPLFFELDGHFPNRPSNPLMLGALDVLKKKVVEEKAVCGIAFDGDCDRVFFVDETGTFIQADMTLLLIAEEMLRTNPGKGIVYNAICSRAVPEFVREMGGVPNRAPVGYVNVKKAMIANDGILGGEVSAHYSFPENFYGDSGFLAALKVLELLSRKDQPLSQLVSRFQKYVRLDEVNFRVADVNVELQKVRDAFRHLQQDELDGVTVWHDDWWVNVRPSNTEPLLRVTLEGANREMAETKLKEVLAILGQ